MLSYFLYNFSCKCRRNIRQPIMKYVRENMFQIINISFRPYLLVSTVESLPKTLSRSISDFENVPEDIKDACVTMIRKCFTEKKENSTRENWSLLCRDHKVGLRASLFDAIDKTFTERGTNIHLCKIKINSFVGLKYTKEWRRDEHDNEDTSTKDMLEAVTFAYRNTTLPVKMIYHPYFLLEHVLCNIKPGR